MWKLYEAVNSTVSSFLTGMVTNESPEAIRLDHFKRLFDDSLQIINEMRECSETQRGDLDSHNQCETRFATDGGSPRRGRGLCEKGVERIQ